MAAEVDSKLQSAIANVSADALATLGNVTLADPAKIYGEKAVPWLQDFLLAEIRRRQAQPAECPPLEPEKWLPRDVLGGTLLAFACLRVSRDAEAAAFCDLLLSIMLGHLGEIALRQHSATIASN